MLKKLYLIFYVNILMSLVLITCLFAKELRHFIERDCFDEYFKQYTEQYFGPHFDWHYFKAQAIAESRLYPDARSPKGAIGLMQILPSTFREIVRKSEDIEGRIIEPRANIAAGIFYNRTLWDGWSGDRAFEDRLNFMFGSYNAGKGNILQAQRLAVKKGLNPHAWTSIARTLPVVTGGSSRETIAYVERVHEIKKALHIESSPQERQEARSFGGHWKGIVRGVGWSQTVSGRKVLNP
jgi:membrane-bound lytic murein transglycosylase MltF